MPQLSIDISCPHGIQQQTRWLLLLSLRSMGQTDRWTEVRLLHRPCSAYYAGSIKKQSQKTSFTYDAIIISHGQSTLIDTDTHFLTIERFFWQQPCICLSNNNNKNNDNNNKRIFIVPSGHNFRGAGWIVFIFTHNYQWWTNDKSNLALQIPNLQVISLKSRLSNPNPPNLVKSPNL